jgi:hypothetical protein
VASPFSNSTITTVWRPAWSYTTTRSSMMESPLRDGLMLNWRKLPSHSLSILFCFWTAH